MAPNGEVSMPTGILYHAFGNTSTERPSWPPPSTGGSCQTAKDDGGKLGVRFLARSKRGTRFMPAWTLLAKHHRISCDLASSKVVVRGRLPLSARSALDRSLDLRR